MLQMEPGGFGQLVAREKSSNVATMDRVHVVMGDG